MKKLIFLFFILSHSIISAQTDSLSLHLSNRPEFKKQFGVNVTDLLSNILNFSSTSNSFNEPIYYFTWRKLGEKSNTRLGLGGEVQSLFDGNQNATDLFLNFRIGKERYHNFAKRLQAYYGWDFKTILALRINGSSNQTQVALGAAPVVGLQLQINERISISTEAAYDLLATFGVRSNTVNAGILTSFVPADAIFLNYKW